MGNIGEMIESDQDHFNSLSLKLAMRAKRCYSSFWRLRLAGYVFFDGIALHSSLRALRCPVGGLENFLQDQGLVLSFLLQAMEYLLGIMTRQLES